MFLVIAINKNQEYTFVSNKLFGQLLDISPENFIFYIWKNI